MVGGKGLALEGRSPGSIRAESVRRARAALFVPTTSIVTTTERTFVVRSQNGRAEWVDVRKGVAEGALQEVIGDLKAGDMVVRRATDELREGAPLPSRAVGAGGNY